MRRTNTESAETTGMFRRSLPGEREMKVVVRVVAGPAMMRYVTIAREQEIDIGRDPTCDLILDDASVSRRHAIIAVDGKGQITVQDLKSTNGTWRDGLRIREIEVAHAGDRIDVGQVAVRIERLGDEEMAHLRRMSENLESARRDPLTGLRTRRWLDDDLPTFISEHEAMSTPCSVLFVDLDHFKGINDGFGHATGDEVLRAAARLIEYVKRESDVAVRYGGEEMIVFLRQCDAARAYQVGERLRAAMEAHPWGNHGITGRNVTVSCGVAGHIRGESPAAWMKRADQALYQAKATGRNRTVIAS